MMRWGRGAAPLIPIRNRSPLADRLAEKSLPFIGSLRSRPFTIIALALISCSTQRSSESQSSYAQKVDTVTERGAVKITTTVREYAPPVGPSPARDRPCHDPLGSRSPGVPDCLSRKGEAGLSSVGSSPLAADDTISGYGPLIREIVRVTERDPVVTHTDSAVQASGSAEAESKSRPFGIFALLAAGWPFLLGACGAAALVILRPPWLIAGWSILKSLFGKGK